VVAPRRRFDARRAAHVRHPLGLLPALASVGPRDDGRLDAARACVLGARARARIRRRRFPPVACARPVSSGHGGGGVDRTTPRARALRRARAYGGPARRHRRMHRDGDAVRRGTADRRRPIDARSARVVGAHARGHSVAAALRDGTRARREGVRARARQRLQGRSRAVAKERRSRALAVSCGSRGARVSRGDRRHAARVRARTLLRSRSAA